MLTVDTNTALAPNKEFTKLASDEQIERVARALEINGMKVLIAENGEEAKKLVLDLVPQGVEIYTNQSKTIDKLGLRAEFDESGRYNAVRPKVMSLDRKTQGDEIRKLRSNPDYIIGSVQAITENRPGNDFLFWRQSAGSVCLWLSQSDLDRWYAKAGEESG